MNWMILLKIKLALAAILVVAGCGTPASVIVQNVRNTPTIITPVVTPVSSATLEQSVPTAFMPSFPPLIRATLVSPTVEPTMGSGHDGMIMPTQAVPVNTGSIPTESGFVLLWEMFGTPTGTPPPSQNSSVDPVNTQIAQVNTQAPLPSLVAASPTPFATATLLKPAGPPTLPPTSTKGVASGLAGDPARGKALFGGSAGCAGCHDTTQGITVSGPSLKGVSTRATSRKPGMSALDYLHESIRQPNAYVVKGFTPGVMLQNYGQTLGNAQIDDLVAYLLTLK